MAFPFFVNTFEVGVLLQVRRLREFGWSAAQGLSLPAGLPQVMSALVAISGAYRDALAPLGATARENGLAALGLHTSAESVHLGTTATVRLECALGHARTALLTIGKRS